MSSYARSLLIVLAAALFLFFFRADRAYESDDIWSLRAVAMPMPEMMRELKGDIHPPLYFFLLRGWRTLFGESEVATRSLSILFCLAAAGFVHGAAREHYGKRGALLALVIFVISPVTGIAAQLVRLYGLLALASAASTYAFLRLMRNPNDGRGLAVYIAANILGSFAQIWFFFLLFAQGVVYLATRRTTGLWRMAFAAILSLTPYCALWLPTLIRQFGNSTGGIAWVEPPTLALLATTVFFQGGLFTLTVPFLWFGWRKQRFLYPNPPAISAAVPAAIAAISILLPFALSYWKPIYGHRWTIVALPATALAVAALAPRREENAGGYRLETGLALSSCGLAVMLSFFASICSSRDAAEYLARHTRPGDTVIFTALSRLPIDYYWNKLQPDRQVVERSYPAEIDQHPAYEGVASVNTHKHVLLPEARVVTDKSAATTGRVFYLHGFRPKTEDLLLGELESRFPKVPELALNCNAMGSYFQYISAFACQSPMAERETRPADLNE